MAAAAASTGMHTRVPPAPSARKRKLIKHSLEPAGEAGVDQAQPAGKRQATHHVNAGSARGAPRDARFVPREHRMHPLADPSVALHGAPVAAWPSKRLLRGCWPWSLVLAFAILCGIFSRQWGDRIGQIVWGRLPGLPSLRPTRAGGEGMLSDHSS